MNILNPFLLSPFQSIKKTPTWFRRMVLLLLVSLAVMWLFSLALTVVISKECRPAGGIDFTLRYHEVRCVLEKVDPFAVTRGEISGGKFVPYLQWSPGKMNLTGYTPWTYVVMLPFGVLPKWLAASCWVLLEGVALLYVLGTLFRLCLDEGLGESQTAIAVFSSLFVLFAPHAAAFGIGNFGLVFSAIILLMARSLNAGRDIEAGLLWALLLMKPQIGILFAVPLLLGRKWKPFVSAAVVCAVGTLLVSLWLRVSPINLLLEVFRDGDVGCYSTDLLPKRLYDMALCVVPKFAILGIHAVVGMLICIVCSLRSRRWKRWEWRLVPAIFFNSVWTYGWDHDRCMQITMLVGCLVLFFHSQSSGLRWKSLAIVVLTAITYGIGPGAFYRHPLPGYILRALSDTGIAAFSWLRNGIRNGFFPLTQVILQSFSAWLRLILLCHILFRFAERPESSNPQSMIPAG